MQRGIVMGLIATLVSGLTMPAGAQTRVEGGVVIQSGPVMGHVEVGSPPQYREPVREVVVVEHVHRRHGHGHRWWKKHGYRPVRVYYDGSRYYGRWHERPVLRIVVVYERRGRYYIGEKYHKRHGHNHDDDDEDDDD